MSNLKTIFSFEFMEMIKKKTVTISTLIITIVLFGVTFVPRILNSELDTDNIPKDLLGQALIISEDPVLLKDLQLIFEEYDDIDFTSSNKDIETLVSSEYERVFVVDATGYTVTVKDMTTPTLSDMFESVYEPYRTNLNLLEVGIDPETVSWAMSDGLEGHVVILDDSLQKNIAFSFVMLFGLYILILMYGQSVATSVAREKDSRTMELLITSTKADELILGKVLAAGLVGILQIATLFLGLLSGYLINKSVYPTFIIEMIQTSLQWDVVLIYIIFSILGYLLYLFIFASLGSLVSKVEDVAGAVTPVTFLFVFAYIIANIGTSSPNAGIVKISSYIPFVSLFTTPIRYALTDVTILEIGISIGLMMVVSYLIMKLSIYIYRQGSLNYGNKMSLIKLLKGKYTTK